MTNQADYTGWTIDVTEGYPFEGQDLTGMDEEASLISYGEAIETALREEYPGITLDYNLIPQQAARTRISVYSPMMEDWTAEERMYADVQQTMESVWDQGSFWTEAKNMRCHYCCQKPPEGQQWEMRMVEIVAGRIRERVCNACTTENALTA